MTEAQLHKLLIKQIRKCSEDGTPETLDVKKFIKVINDHYEWSDRDRQWHDRATLLMSEDLTDANRRIREQGEARFQGLLKNVSDAIITINDKDLIDIFNPAAQRMFGYTNEDIQGMSVLKLFAEGVDELLCEAREDEGLSRVRSEHEAIRKDGEPFPAELSIGSMNWEGMPVVILSIRDVSERHSAEQEREDYTRELALSNAELERFAYVTSHDLQEPLRTVSSFIGLLNKNLKDVLDDEQKEYMGYVMEGAGRMSEMIRGLLDYSRVSGQSMHMKMHSLNELLEEVQIELHAAIEQSSAEINVDSLPDVKIDPAQIKRLYLNLIGNAIKFCRDGAPRVDISAHEKQDHWEFSVRDHGIGIPEDQRDRLFQLFQRLHTRDEFPGTGIGLAMCQKIVIAHGGRLWVDDPDSGPGTVFKFTLHKHDMTS